MWIPGSQEGDRAQYCILILGEGLRIRRREQIASDTGIYGQENLKYISACFCDARRSAKASKVDLGAIDRG